MGIAIFVVGTFVGVTDWHGKLLEDKNADLQRCHAHRQLALRLFVFF